MSDYASDQPGIDVGRYWAILVSRWRAVLAGLLIGVIASVAYLFFVPASYVSFTTLTVLPITSDPYAANRNNNNLIDMDTEATTARSYKVAQLAAESQPSEWEATELREATTVSSGGDSSTMTISVTAESEEKARGGATAMADAYIKVRSDQAKSNIETATLRDQERIRALRESLTSAIKRLAAAKAGSPEAAEASADQQIINQQISAVLAGARSLESVDTTGGVVLNPASITTVTRQPVRVTTLATGVAGGLLLGVIAAFVTHSRRKVVHSHHDLRREFGVKTLGRLDADASAQGMATIAQRLLRIVTREKADVVSLVFDGSRSDHLVLSEGLAVELRKACSPTIVTDSPRSIPEEHEGLVLISVGEDAAAAQRLQAMRLSDLALVVVSPGHTKMADLATVIGDATEMGARVVGAVLIAPLDAHNSDAAPKEDGADADSDRPSGEGSDAADEAGAESVADDAGAESVSEEAGADETAGDETTADSVESAADETAAENVADETRVNGQHASGDEDRAVAKFRRVRR